MEIPEIHIPEIYIPDIPEPYSQHYINIAKPPDIDVPGCTYQHTLDSAPTLLSQYSPAREYEHSS